MLWMHVWVNSALCSKFSLIFSLPVMQKQVAYVQPLWQPVVISLFHAIRVEFTQLAAAYSNVNLGQGFPDFAPPKFVQEAFCQALNEGPLMHQYTRAFVSAACPLTLQTWPFVHIFH